MKNTSTPTTPLRRIPRLLPLAAGLFLASLGITTGETTAPADPGWPRQHVQDNKKLTIYQPQVDEWKDYSVIKIRCAIEIEGVLAEPKFGVAEIEARTLVDQQARTVQLFATKRDVRFSGVSEAEKVSLLKAMVALRPPEQIITVSLDRVLAFLDADTASVQKQVDVNLNPPKIYYSDSPAVLVIFMGEPQFKPVVAAEPDLMFAVNTNWDVFYEPASKSYFLLNGEHWLTSQSAEGPWTAAESLPARLSKLPEDENWAEVRKHVPAKKSAAAARVIASTVPAELVLTAGQPQYDPIPQTKLLEITNTESLLILDSAGGKFYYQAAGRWFRAAKLDGPWSAASSDLPEDFAKIPDDHPLAFVKSTVPGTDEAADAVLLASVPQSTYVDSQKPPTLVVTYQGEPNFQPIPTTTVKYAVNSPYSVFLVDNGYYCCDEGVWFSAKTATGPWAWCTDVPKAIYTIPASSPAHNVTYVTVKESTPGTVVYTQTSGYSGEYVAATGVLMFGAGLVAADLINDSHVHYCYPYPAYYSYGCGAVYHHGYGGYYYGAASSVYGPYGGAGYAAAYNPATGTYARVPTPMAPTAAPDTAPLTIPTPADTPPKATAPPPTAPPQQAAPTIPTRKKESPHAVPPAKKAAPQESAPPKAPAPPHGTPIKAKEPSPKPKTTTSMRHATATFTKRTPTATGAPTPVKAAAGNQRRSLKQNKPHKAKPSAQPPALKAPPVPKIPPHANPPPSHNAPPNVPKPPSASRWIPSPARANAETHKWSAASPFKDLQLQEETKGAAVKEAAAASGAELAFA